MRKSCFTLLSLSLPLCAAMAPRALASACSEAPHTMHSVFVDKSATCVATKLYEPKAFCLVDNKGNDIDGAPFDVVPGTVAQFGMSLTGAADFNMEYALTCVVKDNATVQSPKVMFDIGAFGPGNPNITVTNAYGAEGTWAASDTGGSFTIKF